MPVDGRSLQVGVITGLAPRLITGCGHPESLATYRATGGYRHQFEAGAFLDLVEASGLRGRGGASFPTARKLRTVRAGPGRPVVVANGEEGEPTSVKDRWLLRHRPHLVLEGLLLAAAAVDADLAYVYVSDRQAEQSITEAVGELPTHKIDVRVVRTEPGYVAGEETAAVQFLNGGPALPAEKPPRPYESGVAGRPTLVSNIETLTNLPVLARLGVDGYRSVGTERAPGSFLMTLGGHCAAPGLYEVPLGIPLGTALSALGGREVSGREVGGRARGGTAWGGAVDRPTGFLMGGYFGGLLNQRGLDLRLDYDALGAEGSGLGCGAITVLGPQDCPVRVAAEVMAYFARENAGQCGSCFNGTAAMSALLSAMVDGVAALEQLARLRQLSGFLVRRGACGTLDGAAQLATSLLREFPEVVQEHLGEPCPNCRDSEPICTTAPFAVAVPGTQAELLGS